MSLRPVLPMLFKIELVIAIIGVVFAALCFAKYVFVGEVNNS